VSGSFCISFFLSDFVLTKLIRTDVELKAKIDAFLAERRNRHTALDVPESEVVRMDEDAPAPAGMEQ
jgi:hypothetical protein